MATDHTESPFIMIACVGCKHRPNSVVPGSETLVQGQNGEKGVTERPKKRKGIKQDRVTKKYGRELRKKKKRKIPC